MMATQSGSLWPGRPARIVTMITEIEQELDLTWPGWRAKQPFDGVEYDRLARIKWLLRRHSLLTYEERGVPCPRDWRVIVLRDAKNPTKCYAHPVVPENTAPDITGDPPSVVEMPGAESAPLPSATELAFKHKLPLEHVETALQLVPSPVPPGLDVVALVIQIARALTSRAAPALEVRP
jgi:hypothetical protein